MGLPHRLLTTVLVAGALGSASTRPVGAGVSGLLPARWEARFTLGHDSNLLDISDFEQATFGVPGTSTFFAVDRLSDQFGEGEAEAEWRADDLGGRPRLRLSWERRQYLHNPIKSEDHLTLGLRLRPAGSSRVDLKAEYRPQVYVRHRLDSGALPGEPLFRPEVYERGDLELDVHQPLGKSTAAEILVLGSKRRYDGPFEGRNRETFGGGGAMERTLSKNLVVRGGAEYRATWTENDPGDPDDRSYRDWRAVAGIALAEVPLLETVTLDLELVWRRFTSTNPDDQDHYGRRDQGGEAELEITRRLSRAFSWVSNGILRWRDSNFPETTFDEEGVLQDSELRTGIAWEWQR